MVLTFAQIISLIESDRPDFLQKAAEEAKVYNLHVNGEGVEEYLERIEGHENPNQYELRKKVAKSSKALTRELMSPVYKVFRARGGGIYPEIEEDRSDREEVRERINFINDSGAQGQPIKSWLSTIQLNKMFSDPAGITLIEISQDNPAAYPTIKDLSTIHTYELTGRQLEYVVFKPVILKDDAGQTIRVYDDAFDYTILRKGDTYSIIEQYPNPWGVVPGFSNGFEKGSDTKRPISPIDNIVPPLNTWFETSTTEDAHIILHGFPDDWRYVDPCPTCEGTGMVGNEPCGTCGGKMVRKSPEDVIELNPPTESDQPILNPVSGYTIPPESVPRTLWDRLDRQKEQCFQTMWGTTHQKGKNETATGIFVNVDHVHDNLNAYTYAFQWAHNHILQWMSAIMAPGVITVKVSYGTRYIMYDAGQILKELTEARNSGASELVLNSLTREYLESQFRDQPTERTIAQKLMRVEPFQNQSLDQISQTGDEAALRMKLYYPLWLQAQNPEDLILSTVEQLQQSFYTYAAGNILQGNTTES